MTFDPTLLLPLAVLWPILLAGLGLLPGLGPRILGLLPLGPLPALAAALTSCPIALVSLIDVNRQWFKARCGIDGT